MKTTKKKKSDLGKIKNIEEIGGFSIDNLSYPKESKAQLGICQLASFFTGERTMDGYKVETDKHTYLILIDNGQSCCESWGYLSSDDNLKSFTGDILLEVTLTDTALNTKMLENTDYSDSSEGSGGIQFVTFKTNKSTFQLAVYNSHNGYYGHGILISKDNEILLNDTL